MVHYGKECLRISSYTALFPPAQSQFTCVTMHLPWGTEPALHAEFLGLDVTRFGAWMVSALFLKFL